MSDYFKLEASPKAKKTRHLEADSLAEVLQALRTHRTVAWVRRQNTGAARVGGRFIKFGWAGCTDLLGMMKDGRLLAVECKRPRGGKLSSEQSHFIEMVNQFGGCAFIATSALDVLKNLGDSNDA
jgi:hypothetical protein